MRKSGRSLNLIDAFSLLKSENESILFCCRQQFFFSQLLNDNFGDIAKFHFDNKKLLVRKSRRLHFSLSVNSLTQSHNHQKKGPVANHSSNQAGENSSFIFTVCVKSVPRYHFKLACVVLQMAVKEFFENHCTLKNGEIGCFNRSYRAILGDLEMLQIHFI